jgi:hypothetical protein
VVLLKKRFDFENLLVVKNPATIWLGDRSPATFTLV